MEQKISTKRKKVSFAKWGYFFIIPFFVVYFIFSLIPLGQTFYYSFFERYTDMFEEVSNFVGIQNYIDIFTESNFLEYAKNTIIIWLIGFIPQIIVSLLLAVWFTDRRLKLKGQRFFKTVIYMPNLIMASAFGLMFLTFFSANGPVTNLLMDWGILQEEFRFMDSVVSVRVIIASMNFLMWFGNTTLLLLSGIMGIDEEIFEAARVDGSSSIRTFFQITMPLLKPIFIYVLITSLIGGIQLFDIAQIFTQTQGGPDMTSNTLMMYIYRLISTSKNYGEAGAASVILFIATAILSLGVFFFTNKDKVFKPKKKVIADE